MPLPEAGHQPEVGVVVVHEPEAETTVCVAIRRMARRPPHQWMKPEDGSNKTGEKSPRSLKFRTFPTPLRLLVRNWVGIKLRILRSAMPSPSDRPPRHPVTAITGPPVLAS